MKEILKLLEDNKITDVIIGDVLELDNLEKFTVTRITDIRSAAFYAFGQSKITNKNVALIIDGEYLANVYTVLTEAWFQKTNLIIIALYDSFYNIETNYLKRCLVSDIKFLDKDINLFKDKIISSFNLVGPKLYNIVIGKISTNQNNYDKILEKLLPLMKEKETIITYNSNNINCKCIWKNVDKKYKYGILSKYVAMTTEHDEKTILLVTNECIEIDSNIFNSRFMNNSFKLIILDKNNRVNDYIKWIKSNDINIIECDNLDKDINKLYTENKPTVLVVKDGE